MKWPRIKLTRRRVFILLALLGPGIITANADNDANGVSTYSIAGGDYGYSILWALVLTFIAMAVVQEMCARMGCITRKGLADLIREQFGLKITVLIMAVLLLANLTYTMGDFAGLAAGAELFGIPRYVSIPVGALLIWLIIMRGNYQKVEKILLYLCLIFLAYIVSGFMARPPWGRVLLETVRPSIHMSAPYFAMLLAIVGTTISPWMQFYQQASIRDKGLRARDYGFARWDTYLGAAFSGLVAYFIVVGCAHTINTPGLSIQSVGDAARALGPVAGNLATYLFAFGLINGALLGIAVVPLATAYAICEAFGWESGIGEPFENAAAFYMIFTILIVCGAGILLFPNAPLLLVMLFSQTLNGILVVIILVAMLLLVNNRRIMGKFANTGMTNAIAWTTVGLVVIATLLLLVAPLLTAG